MYGEIEQWIYVRSFARTRLNKRNEIRDIDNRILNDGEKRKEREACLLSMLCEENRWLVLLETICCISILILLRKLVEKIKKTCREFCYIKKAIRK
jgi:hypothetical protein